MRARRRHRPPESCGNRSESKLIAAVAPLRRDGADGRDDAEYEISARNLYAKPRIFAAHRRGS